MINDLLSRVVWFRAESDGLRMAASRKDELHTE